MIKIRYADLPGGLYARAEARGRHTVIYLLPGLTPAQRRAAMVRVRSGARMGKCPRLPATGVARARVADWLRTHAVNAVAVVRLHPFTAVPSIVIILSMAVGVALWTPLSTTVIQRPATGQRPSLNNPPAAISGPPPAISGGLERAGGGHPAATHSAPGSAPSTTALKTQPGSSPAQHGTSGQTPAVTAAPQSSPSATPSPSPSAAPTRSPKQSASAAACLDLGLLNICV
jgi:hypothetical protein